LIFLALTSRRPPGADQSAPVPTPSIDHRYDIAIEFAHRNEAQFAVVTNCFLALLDAPEEQTIHLEQISASLRERGSALAFVPFEFYAAAA
jgi:hypothetical protein